MGTPRKIKGTSQDQCPVAETLAALDLGLYQSPTPDDAIIRLGVVVARAYLAEQKNRQTIAMRCRYILGTCNDTNEMREEAKAILELLGEKP